MSSDISSGPPRDGFNRSAKVTLSQSARDMTIAFAKAVNEAEPGRDLIVVFDWAEMRRVRYPRNSNNWHDLGAGIDLGAYERRQVPADAIVTVDGLAFAVKIDEHTLAQSRQRLIDVDVSAGPRQIVLR